MSLQIGIVGLPNVGKSTLFRALTKKMVPAENFPFCTIDPNVGVVTVPDDRLDQLAEKVETQKIIPTTIEFVDIAGLVAGAHKGEGLGNQFLAHIRAVDAICEVVREFSGEVTHVAGKVDPVSDVATIAIELAMADLVTVRKRIANTDGAARTGNKEAASELVLLREWEKTLAAGDPLVCASRDVTSAKLLKELALLSAKPMLYVLNGDEDVATEVDEAQHRAACPFLSDRPFVVLSAKIEAELAELPDDEAAIMRASLGMNESGLEQLIRASYDLLGLITFFTAGPKEVRAWTVLRGATAPNAAGKIHTDFEKRFIRAEVINWQDLIEHGEAGAKAAGKMRIEGKEYLVQDGDVMLFRTDA
jgi:ribosome-binding ATPase